jgi:hypothetical protein
LTISPCGQNRQAASGTEKPRIILRVRCNATFNQENDLKYIKLLVLTILLLPAILFSDDFRSIKLTYLTSTHNPGHHLIVEIHNTTDDVAVVKCELKTLRIIDRNTSPIEKSSFLISSDEFNRLFEKITKIDVYAIMKNNSGFGTDGTSVTMVVSAPNNSATYYVWSPDYKSAERNTEEFYSIFTDILEICNLSDIIEN